MRHAVALALVLCGCGRSEPPAAPVAKPVTSFASEIEIQLDRPAADEVFKPDAEFEVSGEIVVPPGAPVPDYAMAQFLQGRLNAGSFGLKMKPTDRDHVYSFARAVNAPKRPGAYTVRVEAVIASELPKSEAPAVSRKTKPAAPEPGRAHSQGVRIRVVADGSK